MMRGSLKDIFPWIFALARCKVGSVVNFRKWISGVALGVVVKA